MLISFETVHLYTSLAVLAAALAVLWIQGKGLSYLFFSLVFGIYLISVVSVVIFPIYVPELDIPFRHAVQMNLIPLQFGNCDFLFLCIRNIYENIILTIPFGFGISFIAKIRSRNIVWLSIAVGLIFEISQLMISLAFSSPFRVVDINDVILNAVGVHLGYALFRIFGWLFLALFQKFEISQKHIFAYVHDVVTIAE